MKKLVFLACLAFSLLVGPFSRAKDSPLKFTPLFDLRIRQEVLDGVLYFAPNPDRDWVRFRTRLGLKSQLNSHDFTVRLTNEHRRTLEPESVEFKWDEVIIDQLVWKYTFNRQSSITIGRQFIMWGEGLLVLEGRPLDGSRSMSMDGLRLRWGFGVDELDVFVVHNEKYDPLVLSGDQHRALLNADETGVAAKFRHGRQSYTAIWKNENDPDHLLPQLNTYTVGAQFNWSAMGSWNHYFEVAVQHQRGLPQSPTQTDDTGNALAFQGRSLGHIWGPLAADLGFFFYSGQHNGLKPFRTPWGRWPKWSELYIYTLLGEGGDGRVHVAAWENIAAPRLNFYLQMNKSLRSRWGVAYLMAPAPSWKSRGFLMQTELNFDLIKGVSGHLIWEMLDPGHHQSDISTRPSASEVAHFFRWQVSYSFN